MSRGGEGTVSADKSEARISGVNEVGGEAPDLAPCILGEAPLIEAPRTLKAKMTSQLTEEMKLVRPMILRAL